MHMINGVLTAAIILVYLGGGQEQAALPAGAFAEQAAGITETTENRAAVAATAPVETKAETPPEASGGSTPDRKVDAAAKKAPSTQWVSAGDLQFRPPAKLAGMRKVSVLATGYSAGYESTGKRPGHPEYGITFSGVKVRRDVVSTIAADPDVFPLGTLLYIPGYGYGLVADTGSAIKGNKIDLYYPTADDVYKYWGKKQVDVYVIERGEGRVTETMLTDKIETYQS